jgi:anaerobic selenocysteine-containing dehydrogenase
MELPDNPLGRAAGAALRRVGRRVGPKGIIKAAMAFGPYRRRGVTFDTVARAEHGLDLGALAPTFPDNLHTRDKAIDLAPAEYLADVARLRSHLDAASKRNGELLLIGRRQLRSNNSWLHNSQRLVKGKPRCTLLVHPDDAGRIGLATGDTARGSSRAGTAEALVEVSDEIMPGVVSLPHGWGHARPGIALRVAAETPGTSVNDLTDETFLDRMSGTSGFSGVPVAVEPA